ncbi:MAG: TolC family protein, partial [Planctomycetota bacterium]
WPDPFFMYGYSPRRLQTRAGPVRWKTSLSQRIPFPGKRDADEAMALASAGAARERYAEAGLAVRLWVARAYYDYAYAVRALAINDKSLGLLEEIEKIAQVKYRVGQGSQQDHLKAQVRVIRLKTRAIELQRWRARAESRLNQLLSRPPDAPLGTPPTLASEPQTGPTLAELLEAAYERQPTLQAALEAVRRAEARRSRATLNYLPDVTLGVEYTDIGNANVNYRGEGDGAFAITAGIQLPVSLPARSAAVREAEAEIARAKEELRSVRDGVGQKVRTAFVDTVRAREIERLLRATLIPQARQVLDSARAGYETEKNDFLTLIDAERALDDVEIEAARALADLYSARAELEHAIGGPMGDDDER